MWLQAFYKSKPVQDTPYRSLYLHHKDGSWQVRLSGDTKWGRENAQEIELQTAPDFDKAKEIFDGRFSELQEEGWKAYSPQESWD